MRVSSATLWARLLTELPLIAILRGISPHEAVVVAEALGSAGFLCIEIPLNSPGALESIHMVRERFDGELLIGAGTVLTEAQLAAAHRAGAQVVVSPNTDSGVIAATRLLNLISIPGFLTPTEALTAIAAGATVLKLYPAESTSAAALRALKVILPPSQAIFPVGGITTENMADFMAAGAAGFGIGSSIYSSGTHPDVVQDRATKFVRAWDMGHRRAMNSL